MRANDLSLLVLHPRDARSKFLAPGVSSTVTRLWGALIFIGSIVLFVCSM